MTLDRLLIFLCLVRGMLQLQSLGKFPAVFVLN